MINEIFFKQLRLKKKLFVLQKLLLFLLTQLISLAHKLAFSLTWITNSLLEMIVVLLNLLKDMNVFHIKNKVCLIEINDLLRRKFAVYKEMFFNIIHAFRYSLFHPQHYFNEWLFFEMKAFHANSIRRKWLLSL